MGTRALIDQPSAVLAVHRRYVAAGCDVISTNTWSLPSVLRDDSARLWRPSRPVHWMDIARRGVRVAREAVAAEDASASCAVAFSVNADLDGPAGADTVALLARALADDPPDLVLFETLSLVRASLFATVEALLHTGLPVWRRSAAAGRACAGCSASTGAGRRATRSAGPRAASRRSASTRC